MEGTKTFVGGEEEQQQYQHQQQEQKQEQEQDKKSGLFGQWRQQELLDWLQFPPLLVHVALVLLVGWICSWYDCNLLFVFTVGFAYISYIENRQRQKMESRIRSDERKSTDRKRLLSEAETARWLNNVVESAWPIFLEKFASEEFLMRLAPWFLKKYKPWTAKNVLLQKLYLGTDPPVFTFFRAGRHPTDGDHLVLEMTMNYSASKDMHAAMAVQMRKRLGFGIWTSFHISNLQLEGNLKVGVRLTKGWPVIERLRISFSDAPSIRMVAKPVFSYGVDVTDLPGIAAWLDKMIVDALEHSLVEPNLLVVDVPKLVGEMMDVYARVKSVKKPTADGFAADVLFHAGKTDSVATLLLEILEGESMKPCDPNGKADPYVKVCLGQAEVVTTIKRKTLQPKWHEQFHIPIVNWDSPLRMRVRDKDRFLDDEMGYKNIKIGGFRDGRRHEMWLHLDGVKTGRLHVALTIEEIKAVDIENKENKSWTSPGVSPRALDTRKDVILPASAWSCREERDPSRSGSSSDSWESEADETPLKDECQIVDVGMGKSGCISIVNPGRHVVKEAYSVERLQQHNRSKKGMIVREMEHGKPQRQGNGFDDVQPDLSNPAGEYGVKKSRVSTILRRRSQEEKRGSSPRDVSGELSPNELDIYNVGDAGSRVHMKLKLDDEDVKNLKASGLQDELPLVRESCENQGEDEDKGEDPEKQKLQRSRMKQMGKGVVKQAGKTAQSIGHVFTR